MYNNIILIPNFYHYNLFAKSIFSTFESDNQHNSSMKKVFCYEIESLKKVSEHKNSRELDHLYGLYPDSFRKHVDIPYHEYRGFYWSKIDSKLYSDIYSKDDVKDIETPQNVPYKVDGENYNIHSKHGRVTISIEQADDMFEDYSSKGINLSQTQMIRKYNLKPYEWNAIKNALGLTKLSNIFSPWTEENTPADEFEDMVASKFSKAIENRGLIIEKQYHKQVLKQYEKAIAKDQRNKFITEHTLSELSTLLPNIANVTLPIVEQPKEAISDLVAYIADTHLGAKIKDLQKTADFSPEILAHMLNQYANEINKLNAKRVHLRFIGDLIESFTGLNHKDSWKSMDTNYIGGRVIYECYKMILEFLSQVNNVSSISMLPGNHDRMSADKSEDSKGEIAEAVFYFLRDTLYGYVDVKFDVIVRADVIDGISYIDIHGDKRNANNPKDLVIQYGHNDMFNVVAKGHKHERAISMDSAYMRVYTIPSVFTGNFYSTSNGWSSIGGGTLFYNNGNGIPKVIDVPLNSY